MEHILTNIAAMSLWVLWPSLVYLLLYLLAKDEKRGQIALNIFEYSLFTWILAKIAIIWC